MLIEKHTHLHLNPQQDHKYKEQEHLATACIQHALAVSQLDIIWREVLTILFFQAEAKELGSSADPNGRTGPFPVRLHYLLDLLHPEIAHGACSLPSTLYYCPTVEISLNREAPADTPFPLEGISLINRDLPLWLY